MAVIAKYKFNSTLYADLIPEFNAEFTNYVVTDEATETDSEGNVIKTRVIEHDTLLPTLMRFGRVWVNGESTTDNRTDSLLEILDMNTSELTGCNNMFRYNTNLTSITCEWDTSKVTGMQSMFGYCHKLTSLDVSNFDTSNVTNMYSMFFGCTNLTSLDVSKFDTKNVTSMNSMFQICQSLTSLDVSNFDTSNVTDMNTMFYGCNKLTQLDVSNFNTNNVTTMYAMFYNCYDLTSLDISNFNTNKVTNMNNMFANTQLLKDIGMLYCSQSTINTLSSNITAPSTNVWVEGGIIDDLTSYDNVTYKAYYWEKEVLLNSPLLEGDKIVKKDGKVYHYHKMGMIILDGSEYWNQVQFTSNNNIVRFYANRNIFGLSSTTLINTDYCSNFLLTNFNNRDIDREDVTWGNNELYVKIHSSKLVTQNVDGLKQWLQANPTTIVYELANPYYELISDTSDDLSLSLLSEDNIISNNSLIPTNMNVKNNGMTTVAMQSSTKYTVAFDKDADSSVTIDLCGSTIDTTDNVVEITTPSELANDEITFIGDCEVSNVRILEGSVSGDAIPRESFEGLKNSFEEGKLPSEEDDLAIIKKVDEDTITNWYNTTAKLCPLNKIKPNIDYTLIYNLEILDTNSTAYVSMDLTTGKTSASDNSLYFGVKNGLNTIKFKYGEKPFDEGHQYIFIRPLRRDTTPVQGEYVTYKVSNIYVFEGDWTHLTEEDWNNLGKYKVEYKVVGKNKFDISKMILKNQNQVVVRKEKDAIYIESGTTTSNYFAIAEWKLPTNYFKENVEYKLCNHCSVSNKNAQFVLSYNDENGTKRYKTSSDSNGISYIHSNLYTNLSIYIQLDVSGYTYDNVVCKFQIEEGTVATEYEPYKSYTKTFYLNSPLLEGDTIEDVNGVATHVKRYGKVVLDGSEDWRFQANYTPMIQFRFDPSNINMLQDSQLACDRFKSLSMKTYMSSTEGVFRGTGALACNIDRSKLPTQNTAGFKQWLLANPTTVVYELASPQYEPISTESILCDSYVNGHLDVDSNIPIEKVKFKEPYVELNYLCPNTTYTIQFESDNIGKLNTYFYLGNRYNNINIINGVNKFSMITASEISEPILYFDGIGFNASNIQVVATDRDNIGYFKGIQSSFEDKVIRNKNLFNKNDVILNSMISQTGDIVNNSTYCRTKFIECKPNTPYTCNVGIGINYFDENRTWLGYQNHSTLSPSNAKYLIKCIEIEIDLDIVQIEEGIESTTYEEYNIYNGKYEVKVTLEDENGIISNEFIYLNSPLLKGDRIEMYNGKLCHYHKMSKVVLDGSDDEGWTMTSNDVYNYTSKSTMAFQTNRISRKYGNESIILRSDKFICESKSIIASELLINDKETLRPFSSTSTSLGVCISKSKLSTLDINGFKQWLQENPTTVVYELLEPYYEDITPIQNEFVITSIGESSFTIDSGAIPTDGEITYSVNVKLLNDLEESINNNTSSTDTDLSTILDDIINE